MTKVFISNSADETENIACEIAKDISAPAFIALYGDLGMGKTAFARGFVRNFLPDAVVTSPTYNIVNLYKTEKFDILHYDMYRITDDDDLYSTGFYDSLDGVILAEWCENIPDAIPEYRICVKIERIDDNCRKITVGED